MTKKILHIRIVSPSGAIDPSYIEGATARLRAWGYKVSEGAHARGRWGRFSGTDEDRLADLNEALQDDSVVRIHAEGREKKFVFSMDSRTCALDTSTELVVKKAAFPIRTVWMEDSVFFSTIRNKLMWGKDNRN